MSTVFQKFLSEKKQPQTKKTAKIVTATKPLLLIFTIFAMQVSHAQPDQFHAGKLIADFGKVATIKDAAPIPAGTVFNVSFDVVKSARPGKLNTSLVSAARFLNMHVEAGVNAKDIKLALVIHGGASIDITHDGYYKSAQSEKNANAALVTELIQHGVELYVCGQSAAYHGIKSTDLLPGVKMSLSAMTAHALLQQKGYTVNPF